MIDRKLRHHIIEGLVVVALVAIFGPMLFTPLSKKNYIEPGTPPAFPDKAAYEQSLKPLTPEAPPLAKQKTPLYIAKPEAWVVQVGSFTTKMNAERLLAQLRAQKMRAFTYEQEKNHRFITRVYVGPEPSHKDADNLLAKLEGNFHLKGIVINFNPLEL